MRAIIREVVARQAAPDIYLAETVTFSPGSFWLDMGEGYEPADVTLSVDDLTDALVEALETAVPPPAGNTDTNTTENERLRKGIETIADALILTGALSSEPTMTQIAERLLSLIEGRDDVEETEGQQVPGAAAETPPARPDNVLPMWQEEESQALPTSPPLIDRVGNTDTTTTEREGREG